MKFGLQLILLQIATQAMIVFCQTNTPSESFSLSPVVIPGASNGGCPSTEAREAARQEIQNNVTTILRENYGLLPALPSLTMSQLYGVLAGTAMDDYHENIAAITGISFQAPGPDQPLFGIQVTYLLRNRTTYVAPLRGILSGNGVVTSFMLADGEVLNRIDGVLAHNWINSLTFFSNTGAQYGPYGGVNLGGGGFSLTANNAIVAIFGQFGSRIDGLGVYYY